VRAFITGASRGIGAATARRLASPEAHLGLHYHRHRREAEALAKSLTATGAETFIVGGDLAEPTDIDRLATEVNDRWEALDVLVQNAGTYPRIRFADMTDEQFEACLQANLIGPTRLLRRLLPLLRRSASGRIVFVSSVLAFSGSNHGAHYAAAKAGLVGLARSLARELAPRITVNVVAPGAIDTAILAGDTPAVRAQRAERIPLARVGRAEEVAEAIAFVASPAASYITGATLHVNGGVYLG
jgi:3-oxoacyl-[acyl-carrier protein] reductase